MDRVAALDDVQSLVFRSHADLPHACILGLVLDPDSLDRLALARWVREAVHFGPDRPVGGVRCQLLISGTGLQTLGVPLGESVAVDRAFGLGMACDRSAKALGDRGASAPALWSWNDRRVHLVLLNYGASYESAARAADMAMSSIGPGLTEVYRTASWLPADEREPFGFRDGITRARVDMNTSGTISETDNSMLLGDVVLGHPDATGDCKQPPAVFRNGSLVVVRQLAQDVQSFWRFWLHQALGDEQTAVWLASKSVGRWPNGMPVRESVPGPEPSCNPAIINAPLSFAGDVRGMGCPFGAHIRRANPRDGVPANDEPATNIASLHRMLRRGRVYGGPAPRDWYPRSIGHRGDAPDPDAAKGERGLIFMSLCSDFSRQFEFVQQSWLNQPKHADLRDEVDPVAAGREIPGSSNYFTVPRHLARFRVPAVPSFVVMRGGGYFLMPGKKALMTLLGA